MKAIKIFFVLLLIIHSKNVSCQEITKKNFYPKSSPTDITPPRLIDFTNFKKELPIEDLNHVYDSLAAQGSFSEYVYLFKVDEKGKVIPLTYYNENNALFNPIKKYIIERFNGYKWRPAHKKKHRNIKEPAIMNLTMFLETDVKQISVSIRMDYDGGVQNVYYFNLPLNKTQH